MEQHRVSERTLSELGSLRSVTDLVRMFVRLRALSTALTRPGGRGPRVSGTDCVARAPHSLPTRRCHHRRPRSAAQARPGRATGRGGQGVKFALRTPFSFLEENCRLDLFVCYYSVYSTQCNNYISLDTH